MDVDLTVPLFLRPGNPPLPFVGRTVELARLQGLLARAPVALVWGFSGVGKSALVCAAVASDPARLPRALVVQTAGRDPVAALVEHLRRIGAVADTDVDDDDDDLAARAIVDAIETAGLLVVLEDLPAVAGRLLAVLRLAQRFCRRARVVCVSREDPRQPAFVGQTVAVGPLAVDELVALLVEVQPEMSDAEARRLAAAARGSPWRALQLTLGSENVDTRAGPAASVLALSLAAQGVLRTLSLVSSSLPRDILARATRLPAADVLQSLARRGWLELSGRGLRLPSAARPVVDAVLEAEEAKVRATRLLEAMITSDDDAVLAAAPTLAKRTGDLSVIARLLAARSDDLVVGGHAPALVAVLRELAPRPAPELADHAAALALHAGDGALAGVTLTSPVLQARVRAARGERDAALAALRALPMGADIEIAAAFLELEAPDDARSRLPTLSTAEPPLTAAARAACGDAVDLDAVAQRGREAPAVLALRVAPWRARALLAAGRPGDARAVIDHVLTTHPTAATTTTWGRAALVAGAEAALLQGDLASLAVVASRLNDVDSAGVRRRVSLLSAVANVLRGRLRDAVRVVDDIAVVVRQADADPWLSAGHGRLVRALASLRGQGPGRARVLGALSADLVSDDVIARIPDDPAAALAALGDVVKELQRRDAGGAGLEVLAALVDAAVVARDATAAAQARALAHAADVVGSPRFAAEASSCVPRRPDARSRRRERRSPGILYASPTAGLSAADIVAAGSAPGEVTVRHAFVSADATAMLPADEIPAADVARAARALGALHRSLPVERRTVRGRTIYALRTDLQGSAPWATSLEHLQRVVAGVGVFDTAAGARTMVVFSRHKAGTARSFGILDERLQAPQMPPTGYLDIGGALGSSVDTSAATAAAMKELILARRPFAMGMGRAELAAIAAEPALLKNAPFLVAADWTGDDAPRPSRMANVGDAHVLVLALGELGDRARALLPKSAKPLSTSALQALASGDAGPDATSGPAQIADVAIGLATSAESVERSLSSKAVDLVFSLAGSRVAGLLAVDDVALLENHQNDIHPAPVVVYASSADVSEVFLWLDEARRLTHVRVTRARALARARRSRGRRPKDRARRPQGIGG